MPLERPSLDQGRRTSRRVNGGKGSDVATATNITLGNNGNVFSLTGTTTVDGIAVAGWLPGAVIRLLCGGAMTFRHNIAPAAGFGKLLLNTAANFATATANSSLSLVAEGTPEGTVTQWREVGRSL